MMIELPEARVLARQISGAAVGKQITKVTANQNPHKFAWFSGDPADYAAQLEGRTLRAASDGAGHTCGGNVVIDVGGLLLIASTPVLYHKPGQARAKKHQLLLELDDHGALSFTVQMWGGLFLTPPDFSGIPAMVKNKEAPSPLSEEFDRAYYDALLAGCPQNYSLKAFLATEQRIPGLGNGVLQDILFHARLNPKKKLNTLSGGQKDTLFASLKKTLSDMAQEGGRDTEKDLFGRPGGYRTVLSSKTALQPCPICRSAIRKEAYLGGSIYYCPVCQPV